MKYARLASDLEGMNFWYRTAQEKNIIELQMGSEERQKRLKAKSRYGDISLIVFPAVNPDRFLTGSMPALATSILRGSRF